MVTDRRPPDARFGFTVLGSGSSGNACVIHCPDGDMLLDAGFSARELCSRMADRNIDPRGIKAILITHEHGDHVDGCKKFSDTYGVPVYLSTATCAKLGASKKLPKDVVLIQSGCSFEIMGAHVEPFSISHDVEAVAYVITSCGKRLGYATDLGYVNLLVTTKLSHCDAIVLESNYDTATLRNSSRPLHLKRRIMGRQGHLSNDDAMQLVKSVVCENTRTIVFAHVSRECNDPVKVSQLARQCLCELGRNDITPVVACQASPLSTVWL